jgi:SAM-dependent methyltransferase
MNSAKAVVMRAMRPDHHEMSKVMRFLRRLGMERLAWSLRRLHCPVARESLVLEVGSGGNPYPRANVLLDAYEETRERHWQPLKVDRPMVLGFIERLPFKSGSFDFLIASHVLEHSPNPEKALAEFQRVACAGYIEVPDAFFERLNPYRDHRSEITFWQGQLWIRKKPFWVVDQDLVELYEMRFKRFLTQEIMRKKPFVFHVRYYWDKRINFFVVNPETDSSWQPIMDEVSPVSAQNIKQKIRTIFTDSIRYLLSQNRRNRTINLLDLMICPTCGSEQLEAASNYFRCVTCKGSYEIHNNVARMFPN